MKSISDLEALLETARKALAFDPGRWLVDENGNVCLDAYDRPIIAEPWTGRRDDPRMPHIAAFDPTTAIEILEELIAFKKSPLGPRGESGCSGKEKL